MPNPESIAMRNDAQPIRRHEQGTALVIALVLLLSVTLLSLASVTNSVLEMRMVGADENRMQVHQAADSAVSFVISDFSTYVAGLADGEVRCINLAGGTCANGNSVIGSGVFESGDQLDLTLTLVGSDLPAVRIRDESRVDAGTGDRIGAMDTNARRFEYIIESQLDRRASNRGFAHIWRGYSRQVSVPASATGGDFETCAGGGGVQGCS